MVASTKVNGSTITWTASEFTPGRTGENTKANIKMTRSTVSESISGLTGVFTAEIGQRGNSTVSACTQFPTRARSLAFGRRERGSSGLIENKWT